MIVPYLLKFVVRYYTYEAQDLAMLPRGWRNGTVYLRRALLVTHLLLHLNLGPTLCVQGNREAGLETTERLSNLLTVIQSRTGEASSLSPWLSIFSFFLPQAWILRPRIRSSSGCLVTGALSQNPRRRIGTRR